jgi:hypothetical protein
MAKLMRQQSLAQKASKAAVASTKEQSEEYKKLRLEVSAVGKQFADNNDLKLQDLAFQTGVVGKTEDQKESLQAINDLTKNYDATMNGLLQKQKEWSVGTEEQKGAVGLIKDEMVKVALEYQKQLGLTNEYVSKLQSAKLIEQDRLNTQQNITDEINKQIERQNTLAGIMQSANDKIVDIKFESSQQGKSPLEQQIAKINEDARKAALEAGRVFSSAFEDGGEVKRFDIGGGVGSRLYKGLEDLTPAGAFRGVFGNPYLSGAAGSAANVEQSYLDYVAKNLGLSQDQAAKVIAAENKPVLPYADPRVTADRNAAQIRADIEAGKYQTKEKPDRNVGVTQNIPAATPADARSWHPEGWCTQGCAGPARSRNRPAPAPPQPRSPPPCRQRGPCTSQPRSPSATGGECSWLGPGVGFEAGEGLEHATGLVEGFLVLRGRHRIGHDAGSRLNPYPPAGLGIPGFGGEHHHAADCDRRVEGAVEIHRAVDTGIGAPGVGL